MVLLTQREACELQVIRTSKDRIFAQQLQGEEEDSEAPNPEPDVLGALQDKVCNLIAIYPDLLLSSSM